MSRKHGRVIVWFRRDLRLADNPALSAARISGAEIAPLFIWSPEEDGEWQTGAAGRWWLHHSLAALQEKFASIGSALIIRGGPYLRQLLQLANELDAQRVLWNRLYEPDAVARDSRIKSELLANGLKVESFSGSLLLEPWDNLNSSGKPYRVFTPFWSALCERVDCRAPLPAPRSLPGPSRAVRSLPLSELQLLPKIAWDGGLKQDWRPGEQSARRALAAFIKHGLEDYGELRNRPDLRGTSRLSPALHFGELSPRTVWHKLAGTSSPAPRGGSGPAVFLRELGWREFAHHLLYHFPETASRPLRTEFELFPWEPNQKLLAAWQRGRTGYPIVDAGMRELWKTGWMHNRVRMIAASFLVKDLLQPWQYGARWFWDTLVDADLANNTLGWQWTAGCGADAAPYFRVFNPGLQGQKYDPQGDYVRRWVPELKRLESRYIHEPWNAPQAALLDAGVILGKTYPRPIVDHRSARHAALEAYEALKQQNAS